MTRVVSITATLIMVFLLINYGISPASMEKAFTNVYQSHRWGEGSGYGSKPENAQPYLILLQKYVVNQKIHSIVDLGCGDWQLMRTIKLPDTTRYDGVDVVKSIVEFNTLHYQKPNIHFHYISDLDRFKFKNYDLLIVKDVIQHLPNKDVSYFLKIILPRFRYALITDDYLKNKSNRDIDAGDYRPIDLEEPPFLVKQGLKVILDYPVSGMIKRVYLYTNPNNSSLDEGR